VCGDVQEILSLNLIGVVPESPRRSASGGMPVRRSKMTSQPVSSPRPAR
jgi:septum formation inhibitor-activating ATPase MinD